MDNVTFIEVEGKEYAIIDKGNGEFTSMFKSIYDVQLPVKPKKTITQSE
jgi:hypothetical protein